jgi:guanylate kinase
VNKGKICILDLDIYGLRKALSNGLSVGYKLFIAPPSLEALEDRLLKRKTETKESLKKRIESSQKEIEMAHHLGFFHQIIINKQEDKFINESKALIESWYPFIKINKSNPEGAQKDTQII